MYRNILNNEFHNQCACVRCVCVRWDLATRTSAGSGVKQSGKLSPLLFNIYMDNLSLQLHKQPIGCSIGTTVVNILTYTDDLLLFAPPKDYKHYLTYTDVNTMFNIMLVNPWSWTLILEMKILLGELP